MMPCETVTILGIPVSILDMDSLLLRLQELLAAPGCATAYGVNAHSLNLACQQADFQKALIGGDLIYADGASLLLAARVLGECLPEKLTTTDIWPPLCQLAVDRGTRFFLLGGEPGLAERARDKALEEYPGLQIVGTHDGYFDLGDEAPIDRINAATPDVLWVGMGEPRQALWTEVWKEHLQVKLILTCGGMFKIISGELDRLNPQWRQRGCEWIYRLWQEPNSWRRYLLGLPAFGLRVLAVRFMAIMGSFFNNPPH